VNSNVGGNVQQQQQHQQHMFATGQHGQSDYYQQSKTRDTGE
jgi:hypothetical protein